jgi:hypothetical protein
VAGAAAILLQQHPDWHANEVRAALASTAAYNASVDAYSQGGGRIDVDRATRQRVFVSAGTVDAGYVAANAKNQRSTRTLTYRNTADAPVRLALEAQATTQAGDPAPAATLTVSPATVTVPPGGSATAEVRVELSGRPAGAYNGRVTATGSDGSALGTTVGFVKQGNEVQATFRAIDRNGHHNEAFLVLRSPRVPDAFLPIAVPPGGSATVQLPQDDYSLLGYIRTPYGSTDANAELTVVADPELTVTQPNPTITYDARRAQPFDVRVPRDVDVNGLTVGLQTERPGLDQPIQDALLFARGPSYGSVPKVPMSVLPFDRPRRGHGELDSYWSLVSPRARASVVSPKHRDVAVALMDGSARLDASAELPLVDLGDGTAADFDGVSLTGKLALVRQNTAIPIDDQAAAAASAGATALFVSGAQPGPYFDSVLSSDIPVLAISRADGDLLRSLFGPGHRGVRIHLSGHSSSSYLYDLAFREHDRVGNTVYRPHGHDLAQVRTTYYADDSRTQQRFWQNRTPAFDTICGYCSTSAREGEDWHGAVTRTEYVTAGVPWRESLLQDGWLQWDAVRTYRGGVTQASWAKGPIVPGVPIRYGAVSTRAGDQLQLRLAGFTDAEPTHAAAEPYWWFQGTTTLSRNGESLGECRTFYMLNCDVTVPADLATYTLAVNDPAPIFSDAAQSSKTTWTFHSQPGESRLPLVDLDYDLPVSTTNTIRAGTWTSLHLGVIRQPGSTGGRLDAPSVQVSYDDGATWRATEVRSAGAGQYRVSYRLPPRSATNGFVALRVSAADAGRNSIVQEISRAYRLTS